MNRVVLRESLLKQNKKETKETQTKEKKTIMYKRSIVVSNITKDLIGLDTVVLGLDLLIESVLVSAVLPIVPLDRGERRLKNAPNEPVVGAEAQVLENESVHVINFLLSGLSLIYGE